MSTTSSDQKIFDFLEDKELDSEVKEALYKSLEGKETKKEDAYLLIRSNYIEVLASVASMVRDTTKGKRITYSRKIFIPLTNVCRNICGYCGFRKEPNDEDAEIMKPSKVISFAEVGSKAHCTEALFTLGESPEKKYSEVNEELKKLGYNSTVEYLRNMCDMVTKKTGLLPHSNPGVITRSELADLKEVNASMGLMLENVSDRLCNKGGPHEFSPSKRPALRLDMIKNAGQLKIPFTTGLLIGIGEFPEEIVDSLYAIKEINEKYEHIQEIIIQNFRAKPKTPMESHPEPNVKDIAKTIALARIIFLGKMNIQAPPNLSNEYSAYLSAGINDWGGVSPITRDFINPEAPWPEIEALERLTNQEGFDLKARLPIYPEFILNRDDLLPKSLKGYIISLVNHEGFVKGCF